MNEAGWLASRDAGQMTNFLIRRRQASARKCSPFGPHVRGCWVIDLILGKE
jgi:hypothetical protein